LRLTFFRTVSTLTFMIMTTPLDQNIKTLNFSLLQKGDTFYQTRQDAIDGRAAFTKTESAKNFKGVWTNAKDAHGMSWFIRYDSNVFVKKVP
jgi:hypothetical protein